VQQSIAALSESPIAVETFKGLDFEVDVCNMPVETAVCL
jgi:hypothetical protein